MLTQRLAKVGEEVWVRAKLIRLEWLDDVLWADVEIHGTQMDFKYRDILPADAWLAAPQDQRSKAPGTEREKEGA